MHCCQYCGRSFNRLSNCLRHEKSQHEASIRESNAKPREEEEDESDESGEEEVQESGESEEEEVQESDESGEEEVLESEVDTEESNDESESEASDDDDDDEEHETIWDGFVRDAVDQHEEAYQEKMEQLVEQGFTQTLAKDHAFQEILPDVQKTLRQIYLRTIQLQQQLKKDPTHKKILSTKRKIEDEEGFSEEEAWDYAVKKRKYLLNQLITDKLKEEEVGKNEDGLSHLS